MSVSCRETAAKVAPVRVGWIQNSNLFVSVQDQEVKG
ncbi:hypothetical protein P775_12370 [Puniceibacterium antarcticum]|uniref:Uncharacterized protein n=1 Tax=Puniceibacterium antarcticum TaxID=1206336 RepID=A0A2G8RE53_9RHOB|nr:hypothetical protein P775_12370 [Puniceibacterium antarcticum]